MMATTSNRRGRRLVVLAASAVVLVGLALALRSTRTQDERGLAQGQGEQSPQTSQPGQAEQGEGQGLPSRLLGAGPSVPKLAAPEATGTPGDPSSEVKMKRGTWNAEALREQTKQSE